MLKKLIFNAGTGLFLLKTLKTLFLKYGVKKFEIGMDSPLYNILTIWLQKNKSLFAFNEYVDISGYENVITMSHTGTTIESTAIGEEQKIRSYPITGFYKWGSVYVFIDKAIDKVSLQGSSNPFFKYNIETLQIWSHKVMPYLNELITHTKQYLPGSQLKMLEFHGSQNMGSINVPRYVERLSPDPCEVVIKDFEEFLKNKDWYKQRNLKYKRGYLLYGPAGSGKSSFVQQLALQFKKDLLYVSISSLLDNPTSLRQQALKLSGSGIILIEDIHTLEDLPPSDYHNVPSVHKTEKRKPDYSALLNFLDGSLSYDGQMVFMTSNQIDELPDILLRKGRIDLTIEIGYLSKTKIENNLNNFYGTHYVLNGPVPNITLADLHGSFIFNKNDPRKTIEELGLVIL